jgi:hypothetical protein
MGIGDSQRHTPRHSRHARLVTRISNGAISDELQPGKQTK